MESLIGIGGPHLQHREVPRLGVESELALLFYTTATAMADPSHIRSPHHSSRNAGFLNPLHKARAQTHVLMDSSQILHLLSHNGISLKYDLVMVCTSFLPANSIAFFSFPF